MAAPPTEPSTTKGSRRTIEDAATQAGEPVRSKTHTVRAMTYSQSPVADTAKLASSRR